MRLMTGALALVLTSLSFGDTIKRIQYPAISPDGNTIIFSWQNDLWSVARTGGMATRLTVHASIDSRPVWFRDGSRIAFNSGRYGSADVFTMKPDGTDIRRVTFDSSSEVPTSVSPDGRYIYGQTNLWSRGDIFRVPVTGGDLQRLTNHPFEAPFAAFVSSDGAKVYYNRGSYRETAWQKSTMVSSGLPEIWVADNTVPLSNHKRLTNNENTELTPQVMPDGTIYTISSRGGFPNLWKLGRGEKQLTNHVDGTARNETVSRDGRYVVYEFESSLRVYNTFEETDAEISVTVPEDSRSNAMTEVTVTQAQAFSVSPDGKRIAAMARGEIFLLPEKGGTTRKLTTNPGPDQVPVWLDAKTILYTASEGGRRRIKSVTTDGVVSNFISDPSDNIHSPSVSPDGKWVAYHKGPEEIWVADNTGSGARKLATGNWFDSLSTGAPFFTWSPDGKYIAANFIEGSRTNVGLIEVKSGNVTTVARMVNRPQRGDVSIPQWLPTGKTLFFVSPEYDENDLYLVDLVPTDPTFTEDDLDKIDSPAAAKPSNETRIYLPNIERRLRRLTTQGASLVSVSADGKSILALTQTGLQSFNPVTGAASTVIPAAPGSNLQDLFVANGKLYGINNGVMVSFAPGAPAPSPISMSASYLVDTKVEDMALFEEVGWQMESFYYDPKMHGKDWAAIRAKFAKIVPYAYDRADLYRMMGEMMEELVSSHLGATSPATDFPGSNTEATAFLGIDLDPAKLDAGQVVVARVVPNSPADHPSSQLMVGDRILEVDGEKVGPTPLSALLNKKSLRKVSLTIERGGSRSVVVIKPGANAQRTALEYQAYVDQQRAMVDKLSEGKLGYVHIAAMDQPSLGQFLREIRTQGTGKKGLIIDVRFNGGGSTAVDVLGVLIKTPWMMRSTRGATGVKLSENIYRGDGLEIPTALMSNSFSFSNAEIITEGFRKLKLGPIVGERTPGYVIGTGAAFLWDGGTIRMPMIGAYAVNGDNMENDGRRPDHTVWFDPNAWAEGRDLQLERTISELLKNIK